MADYVISYDLKKQKNYPLLWDALEQAGAQRVLESFWLLQTTSTEDEVLAWFKQFIDSDDRLFVALTNVQHVAGVNLESKAISWVKMKRG